MPVRLEGLRSITWGPRRAPIPPFARQRDRPTWGASTGPPKPPALGSAIDLHGGPRPGPPSPPRSAARSTYMGGLDRAPQAPRARQRPGNAVALLDTTEGKYSASGPCVGSRRCLTSGERAHGGHPTLAQEHEAVAAADGAQAVRDDDEGLGAAQSVDGGDELA